MNKDIRELVRQKYAGALQSKSGCCGSSGCCGGDPDATSAITGNLYQTEEVDGLPKNLLSTSLGCGNPTALGQLFAGETVLDLGSGAGLDVLLSARRVGTSGKAYGLDMTDEMLAEANANMQASGLNNVEFLKGHIEEIPLPDGVVDVVISNCVINLSANKDQVFHEVYRVLKPGGRVAVSDIVSTRPLPDEIRNNLQEWAGCVAGALTQDEYTSKLSDAGFVDIEVEITRVYDLTGPSAQKIVPGIGPEVLAQIEGSLVSAFVRAKKPACRLHSGKDFVIRAARTDDVADIENLLVASGLAAVEVAASIERFLVAERDGIVGVIGSEYDGGSVLIRSVAVASNLTKAGIAAALLEEALVRGEKSGCSEAYLFSSTAPDYFARHRFQPVERSEVPEAFLNNPAVSVCCGSAIAMRLDLTANTD